MSRYLIIGAGLLMLAGSGVALAQMPPPGPDGPRGPMNMNPHERWMMDHSMRHRSSGTSFRFKKGDAELDIACSSRDPLQECVAAASALLDKLNNTAPKPTTSP